MHQRTYAVRAAAVGLLLLAGAVACDRNAVDTSPSTRPNERLHVQRIDHRGLENVLELTRGDARLVIAPQWAGRISVLDFGAGNLALNDPRVDAKVLTADEGWFWWDGNATDFALGVGENRQSQFKGLWLHPYPQVRIEGQRVVLESGPAPEAQLRVVKSYSLGPAGDRVDYDVSIENTAAEQRTWTVWERLLVPGENAYAIAPLKVGGAYDRGWIERDGTENTPAANAAGRDGYLVLRSGVADGAGFAAELRDGWMAYVRGREALLMTYPLAEDGEYPHYDGANAIFYVSGENIELEPLSPTVWLAPGRSYNFPQRWYGLRIPETVDAEDPVAVGAWLEARKAELAGRD